MPPRKQTRKAAAAVADSDDQDTDTESSNLKRARTDDAAEVVVDVTAGRNGWAEHDTLLWRSFVPSSHSERNCARILAFDFDDTLVTTASGKAWPTSASDWAFFHPSVPEVLRKRVEQQQQSGNEQQCLQLVIFTNQKGIGSERKKEKGKKRGPKETAILGRLANFVQQVGLPFKVFAATDDDIYRKPCKGMFEFLSKHLNGNVPIDVANSLFVGDAAGRLDNWKPGVKKDFSCSDREFAMNLGMPFQTPEEFFFHQEPVTNFRHLFDPRTIQFDLPLAVPASPPIVASAQELILMVGFPGSGKSTFTTTHLVPSGYARCNMDELKTKQKVFAKAEEALQQGKKVVIDNTNPEKATRAEYVALAKKYNVPVRIFKMSASKEMAVHMNFHRMKVSGIRRIPDIAYNMFTSKYQEPSLSEGVTEIKVINFSPSFANPKEREQFLEFNPSF